MALRISPFNRQIDSSSIFELQPQLIQGTAAPDNYLHYDGIDVAFGLACKIVSDRQLPPPGRTRWRFNLPQVRRRTDRTALRCGDVGIGGFMTDV